MQTPPGQPMSLVCHQCGTANTAVSKFCSQCGTSLKAAVE
ncbi:MAG: zinc-ribbon domain-containing protein [Dehalococcoidia bacterium]